MSFMNTYKRLDKLCGDLLDDERRLSAYIDTMLDLADGDDYVDSWAEDLEALLHYRRIRNKLAHEPDITEGDLCDADDEEWLLDFYNRILQQTDPLASYRRIKASPNHQPKQTGNPHLAVVIGTVIALVGIIWLFMHYR